MKSRKSFINIVENNKGSKAHKEAIAMGLQYSGFGYWKDPQTGDTTYKTENDQLVPVEAEEQAEKAGEGAPEGPGGIPGGPGAPSPKDASRGATQQPKGPGSASLGQKVGPAPDPGDEQDIEDRKNWIPGPDGDTCLDGTHAPGDIPDDSFVGKTNYYQWTAGPDGTNYMNVSYDAIMKAAKEQRGNQTAQAPPGGMQEETDPSRPHPGARTMMRQVMGAQKMDSDGKMNNTIGKAREAVKGMKADSGKGHQVALGNQIASMMNIVNRGKLNGQETWDAEAGKQNDIWRKALKMPDVKNRADAVKKMNKEAKGLLSDPNFNMEMGEQLGKGSFGKVGISAKDPNVVIKEGQIGPEELKALHAMRNNPAFPSLINAEFTTPFADSETLEGISNHASRASDIESQWWDPEDQSDKPRFPVALGRFAMTKLHGQPLDSYSFLEDEYEQDDDGESGVGDVARKIYQLRGMLHRKGISHNDMHGGNIYIDDNKNLSMLDLGMANDDPLSALTEATGGIGLKDFLTGDTQLASDAQWGNLPRGLANKLMDNASGVREMISEKMGEYTEGLTDDEYTEFEEAIDTLLTGGIRQDKDQLDYLRDKIPMLQDRGGVMKLIERLYDGVGGTDTENTMANAFEKRLEDSRKVALANAIRKRTGQKPIKVPKDVVPPKNLDYDFKNDPKIKALDPDD